MRHRIALGALVALAALTFSGGAFAHAHVSPPVTLTGEGQLLTLAVPTEKAGATTTRVEMTPPSGVAIDSFVPAPGWHRVTQSTGSGESATVIKVTWAGGAVPTGEDAAFSFLASVQKSGSYTFRVRQTYSDGTVVDWSGPESGDTPAPVLIAKSSFGGSGTSTLTIVALVLAGAALLVAVGGLLARSGRAIA